MKTALLILAVSLCACGQQPKSFTVSGNFPRDLYGPIDARMPGQTCGGGPCIWGHADFAALPITFKPPAGYRVRILRLRGDLIAWPKVLDGETPVKPGAYAGVLLGFSTTTKEDSTVCDFCADGTPLYVQGALSDGAVRVPFDYDFRHERVYLDGPVLYLKIASFLNSTGYPIHEEATYSITVRFDK